MNLLTKWLMNSHRWSTDRPYVDCSACLFQPATIILTQGWVKPEGWIQPIEGFLSSLGTGDSPGLCYVWPVPLPPDMQQGWCGVVGGFAFQQPWQWWLFWLLPLLDLAPLPKHPSGGWGSHGQGEELGRWDGAMGRQGAMTGSGMSGRSQGLGSGS